MLRGSVPTHPSHRSSALRRCASRAALKDPPGARRRSGRLVRGAAELAPAGRRRRGPRAAGRADHGRARASTPPAARGADRAVGAGHPPQSGGLLRAGGPMRRSRFSHAERASYPVVVHCCADRRRARPQPGDKRGAAHPRHPARGGYPHLSPPGGTPHVRWRTGRRAPPPRPHHRRGPVAASRAESCGARLRHTRAESSLPGDSTYIRLPRTFVSRACILDAYSRHCVGWHLSRMPDMGLTFVALARARSPTGGPHRGSSTIPTGACSTPAPPLSRAWSASARVGMSARGNPSLRACSRGALLQDIET